MNWWVLGELRDSVSIYEVEIDWEILLALASSLYTLPQTHTLIYSWEHAYKHTNVEKVTFPIWLLPFLHLPHLRYQQVSATLFPNIFQISLHCTLPISSLNLSHQRLSSGQLSDLLTGLCPLSGSHAIYSLPTCHLGRSLQFFNILHFLQQF